ncbi:2'-5' RNA ligase [Pasteurellaceae bacterium LFhippo2]|nr:2'-5' RNA ligase [Pasteurellaceae bacterium LFhippo2]
MQKLIIIRGHSGSGKSTFAMQKIAEFQSEYPQSAIYHIENDKFIEKDGSYHWTPDNFKLAKQQTDQALKNALSFAKANCHSDVLIVVSNVGAKASALRHLINTAKKQRMETEIYRMQNFFQNSHNVDPMTVYSMFIDVRNNPMTTEGEIIIPAIQPMTEQDKQTIQRMQAFSAKNLPKNEEYNSYVTLDYIRFTKNKKLFTAKQSRLYPGLTVLKYARKTFYDNLWDKALIEMRGLIIDSFGNIIVRPFKKCFNYSERKERNSKFPLRLDDDVVVNATVKVNGFLGCCTYIKLDESHPSYHAEFNHKVLFSTTGSLDSDYAKLVEKHCAKHNKLFKDYPNETFLFEICDESDPHIIKEKLGETLIGLVDVKTGYQYKETELDNIAEKYGLNRPLSLTNISFGELKAELKNVKHEGFMVFDLQGELLFKMKSPYYLVSKLLGRSSEENIESKLDKRKVEEEYYPLIDYIKSNKERFNSLDEQQKITFVQTFLEQL